MPAYTRWVNRRLARFFAATAYSAGASPNFVTFLSALVSFGGLAIVVFARPTPWIGIPIAVLLALGYVLDSADGQVARLGKRGSKAGEWIDHVVDSVRTPAIHLAVLIGLNSIATVNRWFLVVAIAYTLLSAGQFMSQILAEQLGGRIESTTSERGAIKSFILLPTDSGVVCWIFLLWGLPQVFAWVYLALFVLNLGHTAISMRRKYQLLVGASARRTETLG